MKPANLEVVEEIATPAAAASSSLPDEKSQRTLKRDNAVLDEFNGTNDPDTLVLYWHFRDRAYDAFNATEYNAQMLRYYASGKKVVAVVPRRIRDSDHLLVCLNTKVQDPENPIDTLCELAFQCQRSFTGISMLVKQRCFVCGRPGAPRCKCQCACFCKGCESEGAAREHQKLCAMIRKFEVAADEETLQLF